MRLVLAAILKEAKICEREFHKDEAKAARRWVEQKFKKNMRVWIETSHSGYDLLAGPSLAEIKEDIELHHGKDSLKGLSFSEVTDARLDKLFGHKEEKKK